MRAADGVGVLHDALAGDRGGHGVERHGGADDVRSLHYGGAQGTVAEDDDAVRVAHDDVRAELRELG